MPILQEAERQVLFAAMTAQDGFSDADDFLPKITRGPEGYGVSCRLPLELYKKWIARIVGSERFRTTVKNNLEHVLDPLLQAHRFRLEMCWDDQGFFFHYCGACLTIRSNAKDGCVSHDIRHDALAATIMLTILGVFLPELYFVLRSLELGVFKLEDWPELPHSSLPASVVIGLA